MTAICFAAGQGPFVRPVLIGLGLTSLLIAAAFIVGQGDVRRLLAYSSVEHMGLLVLGVGLGGAGAYGAVLHTLNNGLAKGLMFLAAGNIVLATGTSAAGEIRGLLRTLPVTGALLVIGLFAVTGSPPFGLFISEFIILRAAFSEHHPWVAATTILLLVVIFVGIAGMILELTYGTPATQSQGAARREAPAERSSLVVAPALLALAVLALGVYIPSPLAEALARAATVLGGHAP